MKIMFISDIHGIKTNLNKVKEVFEKESCDKLVVLGDLYYIGPRNKMKDNYDISYVKEFLESFSDKLICLRGNCDSEVDLMVSNFPIINELSLITTPSKDIYLTHGHIYNENNWKKKDSILIYGHLHIPFIKEIDSNIYINPGSISLPKENFNPSYLIYEDNKFTIYDIYENIIFEKKI
jgi:hypothetical protein